VNKKTTLVPHSELVFDPQFIEILREALDDEVRRRYPPGTQLEFPFSRVRVENNER